MLFDRIRLARKALRLTQQQLAARLGLLRDALSSYESGRHVPSLEHLDRIAQQTGKPCWWFLLPSDPLEFEKTRAVFQQEAEVMRRLRALLAAFKTQMLQAMSSDEGASWEDLPADQLYGAIRAGRLQPLGPEDLRKAEQYLREGGTGASDALIYLYAVWARPRYPSGEPEADYVRRIAAVVGRDQVA